MSKSEEKKKPLGFLRLFFRENRAVNPEELEFMRDVDAAYLRREGKWFYRGYIFLIVTFFILLAASCIVEREEVTRGEGQIILSKGVQPVQSPDGGIIVEILVKENQIVEEGTLLARISNTQAIAEYQDLLNKEVDYRLAIQRLTAEAKGEELIFSDEDKLNHPFVVRDQLRLYAARLERNESEKKELEALLEQKRREVEGSQLTRQHTEKSLLLLKQQEEQVRPLVKSGSYPEMDYLKLRQRIIAQEAELNGLAQTISRAQSAVREAEGRLANLEPERQSKIADEINRFSSELKATREGITARMNRVDRSELRANMKGIIKRILLKEDNVVRPAETVMELLPTEDMLEIEARFRPEDRGFLEKGQNATVKISAYDYTIYGGLAATVENISLDTLEDSKGRPWYAVRLKTNSSSLPGKEDLDVKVGMTVTVDVFSGKKSIFNYLMKPLIKTKLATNVVRHNASAVKKTKEASPVIDMLGEAVTSISQIIKANSNIPEDSLGQQGESVYRSSVMPEAGKQGLLTLPLPGETGEKESSGNGSSSALDSSPLSSGQQNATISNASLVVSESPSAEVQGADSSMAEEQESERSE